VEFGSEKENPSTRAFQRALDRLIKQRSGGQRVPCLRLHGGLGRSVLGNGPESTPPPGCFCARELQSNPRVDKSVWPDFHYSCDDGDVDVHYI
jgi:hypothetical protein